MLLQDALLPDGTRADLRLENGLIAQIAPTGALVDSAEVRNLAGALVLPAFIDAHIHLDKTHMGAPLVPHVAGGSVHERVAAERAARRLVPLPVEERAANLLRRLLVNGTTRVRSHVDIDNDVKLANLEALLAVRERFRDWIDVEIVAFPQSGVIAEAGAAELLDAALAAGADLIGGLDPLNFDREVKGQLDIIFGIADKHGVGIDIHLHDGGEAGGAELREIAQRVTAHGLQGRAVVSHAFALGSLSPQSFGRTADALAKAGVAIMTSSPPPVPVPPVKALRAHGVTVFAASDNIRDCWSPFGNGDMLDRAAIVATRQEFFTNEDLQLAVDLATIEPAKVIGVKDYGLIEGGPADLVVVDAPSVEEAVINRSPRLMTIRRGKIAVEKNMLADALP